ncbi:cobalt-precorrin 5A hydrolase [Desulforamulus ferrireducens]|uniref:Cobalamin biosynthesis protein CbiG n=1 Tax=Desulforamulus ferrireducens TaxID=1833852 RepID=A0A1S6IZ76_9FIRM|nr:cobalt-precorrin 5A hydrolase [Desulforamulus ferrireducens]AQS60075.1 cobalamin biosynthesis protein CbiG [Desulforamulus ferrireducens]
MNSVRHDSIAVLALTAGGAQLARNLARELDKVHLYLPMRLQHPANIKDITYFTDWRQTARDVFQHHRQIVFIMACGIVVRTLAPWLTDKGKDPAVVVMDERGQYAISLLSGHVGGANELAQQVARVTGGTPVITTATDVNGAPAVDLLAQQLSCTVYPASRVKLFNRWLAEGERVKLYSRWPLPADLQQGFAYLDTLDQVPGSGPIIYLTNQLVPATGQPRLLLRPRNLVVGIGCRQGVTLGQVITAVKTACKLGGFSLLSLACLATVDLKLQEPALQQAAAYFKVPLVAVAREEIAKLEGQFTPSDFVRQKIGVGGVCEPAAMLASNGGQIMVTKQKLGPVTVAIAEARLWWLA